MKFTPVNGQFDVQVFNSQTGLTQTTTVQVDLNGLDHDTSLNDIVSQLNSISGITASVTADRRLSIKSDSSDQEIAFANDTSGTLAALGINTFFTGFDANSIGVNRAVVNDPSTFAASQGGIGADTNVAVALSNFSDQALDSQGGASLAQTYGRLASDVTQGSAVAQSTANGASVSTNP